MSVYIYSKTDTDISCFEEIIGLLRDTEKEMQFIIENRRSYRECCNMINSLAPSDVIVVRSLSDLGGNMSDVVERLDAILGKGNVLVVSDIPTTYAYGIQQPMNKAILETVRQTIVSNHPNVLAMRQKPSVGRNRIEFPANWDELYEKWSSHEISSKEFIKESGLKKATFYNLLTEYMTIQKVNAEYIKKYNPA